MPDAAPRPRDPLAMDALSQDTKTRILDAAESLFMEHGFEATSLRQLTTAAGVNLAAVNYHFGTKEELFQAVLTRRLDPMNQERIDLLDELEREAGGQPAHLREDPLGDAHPGAARSRATRSAAARTSCACWGAPTPTRRPSSAISSRPSTPR